MDWRKCKSLRSVSVLVGKTLSIIVLTSVMSRNALSVTPLHVKIL